MKNTFIIAAMLFAGTAVAKTSHNSFANQTIGIELAQEKVKINPENLPDAVKATIAADETIAALAITEAWETVSPEKEVHYIVTFDNGTEEKLSKKYDMSGNEIAE